MGVGSEIVSDCFYHQHNGGGVYTFITHIACLSSMIWHAICCVNREFAKVCSVVDKVTCPCLWVNSKDSQRTRNPISNDAGFTAVAFVG